MPEGVQELLNNISPGKTIIEFSTQFVEEYKVSGNVLMLPLRFSSDVNSSVIGIEILKTAYCTFNFNNRAENEEDYINSITYRPIAGIARTINYKDVIHIREEQSSPVFSCSKVATAKKVLTYLNTNIHALNNISSKQGLLGALSINNGNKINNFGQDVPKRLDKATDSSDTEKFLNEHNSLSGLPFAIIKGDAKYHDTTVDMRKLDYSKTNRDRIIQVSNLFNVPAPLIFDDINTNYNNLEQAKEAFIYDELKPLAKVIVSALNRVLIGQDILRGGTLDFTFLSTPEVSKEIKDKVDTFMPLFQPGIVSAQYIRELLNIPEDAAPEEQPRNNNEDEE